MPKSMWRFESSVNPEGIQTKILSVGKQYKFESSVNPEGIQTFSITFYLSCCLRVV